MTSEAREKIAQIIHRHYSAQAETAWDAADEILILLPTTGNGWREINEDAKTGDYFLIARDMGEPWGWVRGVGYWACLDGLFGWIPMCGASEIPGVLGLAHPTHYAPFPKVDLPSAWRAFRPIGC